MNTALTKAERDLVEEVLFWHEASPDHLPISVINKCVTVLQERRDNALGTN